MARLSDDQWATVRAEWEEDPKLSYNDVASKHGISKQAVHAKCRDQGWKKRGEQASINEHAIRIADAASTPIAPEVDAEKEVVKKRQVDDPGAYKRMVSRDEAEEKRATVLVKHRDEILKLDQMQNASQGLYVNAIRTKDKDDWWRAKIASDTMREQVAASKMKQDMERKAWGMDVQLSPDALRGLSDAQLEAIAAGKMP